MSAYGRKVEVKHKTGNIYFHQWIAAEMGYLYALVEYEDGTIGKCDRKDIVFVTSLYEIEEDYMKGRKK